MLMVFGGVNKLVPNFGNKSKYVLHCRNLQLYLSLGMKLTKVHKILKCKQSDWLKKYIDFNTRNRKKLSKRITVRLVNNAKDYKKWVRRPSFVSHKILSKNVVPIHEIKPVLTLDKPIYVAFSILDLSKHLMYEFHHSYIKSRFNVNLLFTDTDSLIYEIKTDDLYEDFSEDKSLFDFSDYQQDSIFFLSCQ